MLRETYSGFSFTGTQGLMAASSQLSEALTPLVLNPSETTTGVNVKYLNTQTAGVPMLLFPCHDDCLLVTCLNKNKYRITVLNKDKSSHL